jgi:hypothetical protein
MLHFGAPWDGRAQTLGQFIDASLGYMKLLQPLHPLFREGLHLIGESRKTSPLLSRDLSNLAPWVLAEGWYGQAPKDWFTALTSEGKPTLSSTSKMGFDFSVGNLRKPADGAIRIDFRWGASDGEGGGPHIEFPCAGAPEFENYDFMKALMHMTVSYFQSSLAYATRADFKERQHGHEETVLNMQTIGWMNYFANPAVRTALPPDVQAEPFGPGGVLISLQRQPPSADDEDAVARAIRIRQALLPGDWLGYEAMRG